MTSLFDNERQWAATTWLRLVKWINGSMASVFTAIAAAYEARPDAVKAALSQVPAWAYLLCAVPFFALVHHALQRAKNV